MAVTRLLVVMVMALLTQDIDCVTMVTVKVETLKAIHDVGSMFLGVTLDAGNIHDHWSRINLRDPTVRAMARALAPCHLRVGGTPADALTFDPNNQERSSPPPPKHSKFNMTAEDWEELNVFVAAANWSLIFGLNVLKRHGQDWDPANARQLLDFSQRKGFPLAGLELGNEPNIFPHQYNVTVAPDQLARDFVALLGVKATYPDFRSSLVLGPDLTGVEKDSDAQFMATFLSSGGGQAVDIVTFHHYYMSAERGKESRFLEVKTLESLRPELQTGLDLVAAHAPGKQLWLGETSSAYEGGVPGVSDRYVASFLWLDKLGLTAQMGLHGVLRQGYFGGNYGLLNSTQQPTSDYWMSVLYKRLVGGRVLSVSTSDSSNQTRVYAHCGRTPNSVVLFAMNLNSDPVQLELFPFPNASLRLYFFSPVDGDLLSTTVLLNGRLLAMNGQELPPLVPTLHQGPVTLPGLRFAFIQVDDVTVAACS